jgi:hypothetical protein
LEYDGGERLHVVPGYGGRVEVGNGDAGYADNTDLWPSESEDIRPPERGSNGMVDAPCASISDTVCDDPQVKRRLGRPRFVGCAILVFAWAMTVSNLALDKIQMGINIPVSVSRFSLESLGECPARKVPSFRPPSEVLSSGMGVICCNFRKLFQIDNITAKTRITIPGMIVEL